MAVRKVLGDRGDTQRLLRTVRGRGYRLVVPVGGPGPSAVPRPAVACASPSSRGPDAPVPSLTTPCWAASRDRPRWCPIPPS
jgi:DNA-binding winged helix-turn-helix (wHTH) protein